MFKVYCLYHKKIMGILFYVMRKLGVKSLKVNAELGLAPALSIVCGHYYLCTVNTLNMFQQLICVTNCYGVNGVLLCGLS